MRVGGVRVSFGRCFRHLAVAALAGAVLIATADPSEAARRRKRYYKSYYSPPYAALVVDAKTNRVLHAAAPDAIRHPASITKVMTLYLLFEDMERGKFNLDSRLRISANAARQAPSKLGLEPGETIRVEDAIKALVTKSANDIAVAVAENLGGSEEEFAERMTQRARSLGMSRTTFVNASGLPNTEQVTTARDLVRLGIAIHDRFPKQYKYFATRAFEFEGAYYRNHNKLLGRIEAIDGIKTGYVRMSGFNLLTSARADGRHLVAVVLGGRSGRSRDGIMAGLVGRHLPQAFAGRRTTQPVLAAAADDDEEEATPTTARRQQLARAPQQATPPPATPTPPLRAPSLTATGAALGAVAPPPRPIGEPADLRNIRPAVATAKGTPPTPGVAVALRAPEPPARPVETPAPPARPADAPTPAGKGAQRLVPPADIGAAPLAFTGPPDRRSAVRPALDFRPTGALKPAPEAPVDIETARPTNKPEPKVEPKLVAQAKPVEAPKPVETAKPTEPPKAIEPLRPSPAPAVADGDRAAPGAWVIQLGALPEKDKALDMLERARAKATGALAKARPFTEPVEKGGATLWRARFAGFDPDSAKAACRTLQQSGFACFATKA